MSNGVTYFKSKDSISKKLGLLAPMLIQDFHFNVWSMDFIPGVPLCAGFNTIFILINCQNYISHYLFKYEGKLSIPKYTTLLF